MTSLFSFRSKEYTLFCILCRVKRTFASKVSFIEHTTLAPLNRVPSVCPPSARLNPLLVNESQVSKPKIKSTIESAASQLRTLVLATDEGTLLGSEETLIAKLGVSRATVRQVARLLEREGLLHVRRGISGGYFATRPDLHTIETAVSTYLEMVHTESEDITVVASALWIEVLRRAARSRTAKSKALAQEYLEKLRTMRLDASFDDVLEIEQESRKAIFELVHTPYIELIFQINIAFAQRRFPPGGVPRPGAKDEIESHREFVREWRHAKQLEFESIADGDPEFAAMAARHARKLWHRRIWNHDTQ